MHGGRPQQETGQEERCGGHAAATRVQPAVPPAQQTRHQTGRVTGEQRLVLAIHTCGRVPTAQGKQGNWPGKAQGIWKFGQSTGNLVCSSCEFSYSKGKRYFNICRKNLRFFLSWISLPSQFFFNIRGLPFSTYASRWGGGGVQMSYTFPLCITCKKGGRGSR